MLGGTAGRTTLAGEGLQHQDGNSHILALPIPTMRAYDPAFAFEIAVIIQDGIRRMYKDGENIFYYITVMNEAYAMPPMPAGVEEGILKGMYKFRASEKKTKLRAQLFGSGAILREVLKAQEILAEKYGVSADVWSVTSYKSLYTDGIDAERWNLLHSGETARVPYVTQCLKGSEGVLVAASDYLKVLPNLISRWTPRRLASLGTDGFGRSESREALRDFFEVDARFITLATLHELFLEGKIESAVVQQAVKDLEINLNKPNPLFS
jgi:pyruvate dehydrogenase E1 component